MLLGVINFKKKTLNCLNYYRIKHDKSAILKSYYNDSYHVAITY